tara:strand:- start:1878 stop:2036 length:159 start_codon:yes stop_codon:yes gene_type:complete
MIKQQQNKLRNAIESILDIDEFNVQIDHEKEDASYIAAHRKVVLETFGGLYE